MRFLASLRETRNSEASAIYAAGSLLVAAGYSQDAGGSPIPCYWTAEDERVDLVEADSGLDGHVSDVTVRGIVAQVYTVGWLDNGIGAGGFCPADKDVSFVNYPSGEDTASANRMSYKAATNTFLIAGASPALSSPRGSRAVYWKNATPFTLEHRYDNFSEATAAATHEDDFFVSGYYTYKTVAWGSVGYEPVYWINGTITRVLPVIQTGGDYGGVAKDIFAVD